MLGDQLVVGTALDDAAMVQHHDGIRVLDGGQTVSDDDDDNEDTTSVPAPTATVGDVKINLTGLTEITAERIVTLIPSNSDWEAAVYHPSVKTNSDRLTQMNFPPSPTSSASDPHKKALPLQKGRGLCVLSVDEEDGEVVDVGAGGAGVEQAVHRL